MRHKHRQGRSYYLDFLAEAAQTLGGHRVRSMLMVGIEPMESTLEGVRAILERGCVPVLSPFKPDPATPMADARPPAWEETLELYLRAQELADDLGGSLGPTCPPCTHNTLSFARRDSDGAAVYDYARPALFAGV